MADAEDLKSLVPLKEHVGSTPTPRISFLSTFSGPDWAKKYLNKNWFYPSEAQVKFYEDETLEFTKKHLEHLEKRMALNEGSIIGGAQYSEAKCATESPIPHDDCKLSYRDTHTVIDGKRIHYTPEGKIEFKQDSTVISMERKTLKKVLRLAENIIDHEKMAEERHKQWKEERLKNLQIEMASVKEMK